MKRRRWLSRAALYVTVVGVCLVALLPIVWTFLTSFETQEEVYRFPPTLFPSSFHYRNYVEIFGTSQYQTFALNSVVVAVTSTLITMFLACLAAYAFSTVQFRGNFSLMLFVLVTRMVPGVAIVVPLYILAQRLEIYDTRANLILLYVVTTLPLAIWLLKTSFDAVPQSLLDAARIDGCSELRILGSVFLPVAVPGLVTTLIITFLTNWNEFVLAQIFTSTAASKTLQVAVGALTGAEYGIHWGNLTALGMAIVLPTLLLAIGIQRYVVSGLISGAVK
jgi:multiple sugar transport system permease protein